MAHMSHEFAWIDRLPLEEKLKFCRAFSIAVKGLGNAEVGLKEGGGLFFGHLVEGIRACVDIAEATGEISFEQYT